MRAYLELVRFPNLFTAVADVLAGYLYAGGLPARWGELVVLCFASALLYAGGVALNDVFDVGQDRAERPARPIPSGRIARGHAGTLAASLLVIGVAMTGFVSARSLALASALVACIVLYDGALKRTAAGPILMGACRGLNLALGIGAGSCLFAWPGIVPILLHASFVAWVTFFAAREVQNPGRWRLAVGGSGVTASAAGLVVLYALVPQPHASYLVGVLIVVGITGAATLRSVVALEPKGVQAAVRTFLLMLVAFDACLAWSAEGVYAGAAVLLLIVPAVGFSRVIGMT